MTFQELGVILRQERLQRGFSLEEVMHETKMSRRHIEAIEEGRVEDLPHPVYVKGFVKIYASMLGVEVKGISATVDKAFVSVMEDECQDERRRSRVKKDIPLNVGHRKSALTGIVPILIVLLLIAGTGYAVWVFFFKPPEMLPVTVEPVPSSAPAAEAPAPTPSTDAQPGVTAFIPATPATPAIPEQPVPSVPEEPLVVSDSAPVADVGASDAAAPPQEGLLVAPPLAGPQAPPESAGEQGGAAVPAPQDSTSEAAQNTGPKPIVIASAEARAADRANIHILEVEGNGECWIEAKVDKDFTTDFYVRGGERVEVWFTRSLAVKFGNIGVVSMRYDGAPFTTNVPPSGVKTLSFPPAP